MNRSLSINTSDIHEIETEFESSLWQNDQQKPHKCTRPKAIIRCAHVSSDKVKVNVVRQRVSSSSAFFCILFVR